MLEVDRLPIKPNDYKEGAKPDVLLLVDSYKNTVDGRKNFFDNIEKVKLPYCKSLVVHWQ